MSLSVDTSGYVLVEAAALRVSLVDAVSFTVMEAEGGKDVLGLDADFATEGFRLTPR